MKKTYECMVLLDNREVKQGWEPLKDRIAGLFRKHEAEVVSARRWDERRLAFPIKGQKRSTYLLVYYQTDPTGNTRIRRELELSEVVLRHMISTCDEVPPQAMEPEAEFDVAAIPTDDEPVRAAAEEEGEAEVAAESGESKGGDADNGEVTEAKAKAKPEGEGEEQAQ